MSYLGNSPQTIITIDYVYIATAGQTIVTGLDRDGKVLSLNTNRFDVFLNGRLIPTTDYTFGASSVTFNSLLNVNDIVTIRSFGTWQTNSNLSIGGGTMTGPIVLAADPAAPLQATTKQYTDAAVSPIQNIGATVSANALTITWTPASTQFQFRNPTLTSGAPVVAAVSSALSLTVPSTATLGTINAVQAQLVLVVLYNGGTPVLGVVNIAGGSNIDETGLASTTAIAGGSNSANTIYTASVVTNSPYRVVGYINITEAVAGTWATSPTLVQGAGDEAGTSLQSLGFGQTWQPVTRTSGTTYYNTTNRPIIVKRNLNTSSSLTCVAIVGGVSIGTIMGMYNASGTQETSGSFIVPPGMSYSMTDGGTGITLIGTWELR